MIAENQFFFDCSRSMAITIFIDGLLVRSRHCGHFGHLNRFAAYAGIYGEKKIRNIHVIEGSRP